MRRILIVDDNKNNRLFLNALLEEHFEGIAEESLQVIEAENGKVAVALCASERFDMVLMDIMMPEMDGIEATKQIRQSNKEVMIIAVSAADDAQRKKAILDNGAEDYVHKPVDADIFKSRLFNYFALIDARSHRHLNKEACNLYSQEVFRRQLVFLIDSEDALSEFWEYYLLSDSIRYEMINDVVRTVAAIVELFVRLEIPTRIVAEESDEQLYLTIEKLDHLDKRMIDLVMRKNSAVKEFRRESDRMSLVVPKETETVEVSPPLHSEPEPRVETPSIIEEVEVKKRTEDELFVFDFIDPEDLDEIEVYLGKLESLFLLLGQSDVTEDETTEIFTYLERIGRMMSTYAETYNMGQAVVKLSEEISSHMDEFRANSSSIGPMCSAFGRDLLQWDRMLFHEGAPSVHYLDDTVIANAKMIGSMLAINDKGEDDSDDLDDIFDF